jgi:hypothetical protein
MVNAFIVYNISQLQKEFKHGQDERYGPIDER